MIFFKEVVLLLISQSAILDMYFIAANNTLIQLKAVVNQNKEPQELMPIIRDLVDKLESEFKKLKDANDKVITRSRRKLNETIQT